MPYSLRTGAVDLTPVERRQYRVGARRRRRRKIIVLIFALLFILCVFVILRAVIGLPYETVDLSKLAKVEFSGFNKDGAVAIAVDDAAVDELMSAVKSQYESAWFNTHEIEDGDYAKFRQSLSFTTPNSVGLSNGDKITVVGSCDEELAQKLKIDIKETSGVFTVEGLQNVTPISVDEVFAGLKVTFSGISPGLTIALANESAQPLVKKMIFEIEEPKEYYREGDTIRIRAKYTEDMCRETGYIVNAPEEECVKEYTAEADSSYVTSAAKLPKSVIEEAITAGKKAFTDANEYGVRIFCEANLVPVYIDKKATFVYGTPNYVSSYFKTVLPGHAGDLGMSYNDLDIIYDVVISQADGKKCTAYAAVRFSDIIENSDGTFSYDFSSPQLLSESYFSARVKKVVVDSYYDTHEVERVNP